MRRFKLGAVVRRRDFITFLGGAVAGMAANCAGGTGRRRRWLDSWASGLPPPGGASLRMEEAFWEGLRELGYVEGKSINIEFRWAETADELRDRAASLSAR